MCVTPNILHPQGHFYPGSEAVLVPCRHCWQCRQAAVHMWTGRNLAEAATSSASFAVTFTYGRDYDGRSDHVQSVQLMYEDMQKFLKRLRKRGHKVRYTIGGEYGAGLGRAHWHGVFHFENTYPAEWEGDHLTWTQDHWDKVGGIHIPEWAIYGEPLGFVHINKASYAHVAYALKYLMKDQLDPHKHTVFHMSKGTGTETDGPLGYKYFMQLAEETAQAGLPIHDLGYSFTVITRSGEQKKMDFLLKGRLVELYMQRYVDAWHRHNPNRNLPRTDLLDIWAEWGRVGNEDILTANATEERAKQEKYDQKYAERKAKSLAEWRQKRDKEWMRERTAQRVKERQSGKAHKQRQREQQLSTEREQRRSACAIIGITEARYQALPPAWRKFIVGNPIGAKSLFWYKDT